MITSRTVNLLKNAILLKPNTKQFLQKVRNSHDHHWNYRVGSPPAPKQIQLAAEVVGGFAWWWILWHLVTEPNHIYGDFAFPDASKWTDEELGIPPEE